MSTHEIVTDAITLTVPVLTAVVGWLGIQFQDWRVRRNSAARRRLALEAATKHVVFATEWWKASQLIVEDADALTEARARAAMLMAEAGSLVTSVPAATPKQQPMAMTRRLLLLYPLTRRSAEVIRVFYYALLVLLVSGAGIVATDKLDPSGSEWLVDDLVTTSVFGAAALAVRFWAVRVEEAGTDLTRARPSPIGRLLLLYPVRRWSARVIKTGFFLLLAGIVALAWSRVAIMRKQPATIAETTALLAALLGCAAALSAWVRSIAPGESAAPPGPLRHALLLYRLRHPGAQVIRAVSYVWIAFVALVDADIWGEDGWRAGAASGAIALVPSAGLHLWAGIINRGGFPPDPGPVRTALLLYPLQRRGAKVVRAVFHVWALIAAPVLPMVLLDIRAVVASRGSIIAVVIGFAPMVLLRYLAVALNRHRAAPPEDSFHAVDESTTLQQPAGPAEAGGVLAPAE